MEKEKIIEYIESLGYSPLYRTGDYSLLCYVNTTKQLSVMLNFFSNTWNIEKQINLVVTAHSDQNPMSSLLKRFSFIESKFNNLSCDDIEE